MHHSFVYIGRKKTIKTLIAMRKLTLLPLLLWAAWPLGAQTMNTESQWFSPEGSHNTMTLIVTDSTHAQMAFTIQGQHYETVSHLVGERWMIDIPLEYGNRLTGDCRMLTDSTLQFNWAICRDSDKPWEDMGEELNQGTVILQTARQTDNQSNQLSTAN